MPVFNCKICGQEAFVKSSHQKNGWGIYCSNRCNAEAQKNGRLFACHVCGKEIYRSVKFQIRSRSGKFFCSKSCQTIWRNSFFSGENHSNWQGGTSTYRNILRGGGVEQVCKRCKSDDTRTLTAHHKDRNRKNNSISNLIWLCHNCHYLVHHYKSETRNFIETAS